MSKAEVYHEIRQRLHETIRGVEILQGIAADTLDDSTLNRELSKAAHFLSRAELRAATGEDAETLIEGLSPEGRAFVRR